MNNYFIGIGVAKAGTSWLGEYFKTHPEICFSPVKEIHYFDSLFLNNLEKIATKRIRSIQNKTSKLKIETKQSTLFSLQQNCFLIQMLSTPSAYHKYFDWLKKKEEKICGEITPEYSLLGLKGFKSIKKLLNNPKIILILRNPVERQWSQVRFHGKFEPKISFDDYFIESFKLKRFVLWSSYQVLIKRLYSIFRKQDVHIIFYEDLFNKSNAEVVIQNLCHFLDVTYKKPHLEKKINESPKIKLKDELRRMGIQKLKKSYQYVYENFDVLPGNWLNDLRLIKSI